MDPTLRGRTVAVTGGAGYLGRRLVAALAPHNAVRVLDPTHPDALPAGAEWLQCDVRDRAAVDAGLAGADVVFHRAGLLGNLPSMREPLRYYDVNVRGTLNVLEAAVRHGVARLLFDSTAMVYGPAVESPVSEDAPARPVSIYGATKLVCEHLVRLHDERHGLSTLTLRFCRVRDASRVDVVHVLARNVRDGAPVVLADDGRPALDFVDLEDATRAALAGAVAGARAQAINIGCGEEITLAALLAEVERGLDKRAARVESQRPSRRPPDAEYLFGPERFHLSVARARERLGFTPHVTLQAMIDETVRLARRGDG